MSASLVGSEMCIRDRKDPGPQRADCAPELPAGARAARRPGRASPGAVSYTHLTLPTICSV
eukprot:6096686-Alexandrium_andersonii.AAC.1